jgi:hypothetical protein
MFAYWLCNFGSILKHFEITSLQRRICTCLSIDYTTLDLFWSISQALFNHISAMYMPFYWLCSFGSILNHFSSTFQPHFKNLYKSDFWFSEDVFLLTLPLWIYSEAFRNHISAKKDMYMPFYWLCNFRSILKHFSSTISEALFNHVNILLCRRDWKVLEKCFRIDPKLHSQ